LSFPDKKEKHHHKRSSRLTDIIEIDGGGGLGGSVGSVIQNHLGSLITFSSGVGSLQQSNFDSGKNILLGSDSFTDSGTTFPINNTTTPFILSASRFAIVIPNDGQLFNLQVNVVAEFISSGSQPETDYIFTLYKSSSINELPAAILPYVTTGLSVTTSIPAGTYTSPLVFNSPNITLNSVAVNKADKIVLVVTTNQPSSAVNFTNLALSASVFYSF
jgi:hypothetical protein